MKFSICLLLILGMAAQPLAGSAGPGQFELVAALPSSPIARIAALPGRLVALGERQFFTIPSSNSGPRLSHDNVWNLMIDYEDICATPDRAYLTSRSKRLAVVDLSLPNQPPIEIAISDTVFNAVARHDTLIAACGLDGVVIYDFAIPEQPKIAHRLTAGAYYTLVEIRGDLLVAADALNGIDIFDLSQSPPVRLRTILLDQPPLDIASVAGGFAICDGSETVTVRELAANGSAPISSLVDAGFPVSLLAADSTTLLAADNFSKARVFDVETGDEEQTLPLGSPIVDAAAFQVGEESGFAVCSVSGEIETVVMSSDMSINRRIYLPDAAFTAAVNFGDDLLYTTAAGDLHRLRADETEGKRLVAVGYSDLMAAAERVLFVGSTNSTFISIYERDRFDRFLPLRTLTLDQPARDLFACVTTSGDLRLVVAQSTGASVYRIDLIEGDVALEFSLQVDFAVAMAAASDSLLLLADDRGIAALFKLDSPPLESLRVQFGDEAPRALLLVENRYIVAAGSSGVNVFEIAADLSGIISLPRPNAIYSATDVVYLAADQILVVADGVDRVRYLDFSGPSALAAVYSIEGSQGVSRLAATTERILAFGSARALVFDFYSDAESAGPIASNISLSPFFPNPFNASTSAAVDLDASLLNRPVSFDVVNLLGQSVYSQVLPSARRILVNWDGCDQLGRTLASGVYFMRITAGPSQTTRKVLFLK